MIPAPPRTHRFDRAVRDRSDGPSPRRLATGPSGRGVVYPPRCHHCRLVGHATILTDRACGDGAIVRHRLRDALLFGPHVTMLVALAGALSQELAGDEQPPMPRRLFYNLAAILTATQAAGLAYQTLDGIAKVGWPWQVHVVAGGRRVCRGEAALARSPRLLSVTQAANRQWSERAPRAHPTSSWVRACCGLAALIEHRMWDVLALAAIPLYFACRDYCAHVVGVEDEQRRLEVVAALDEGMAVIDADGRISFWNDVLAAPSAAAASAPCTAR